MPSFCSVLPDIPNPASPGGGGGGGRRGGAPSDAIATTLPGRQRWRCMQPRMCPLCWKTFSNSFNLKQHVVNVHTVGQGLQCQLCHKTVKNKWYLRKHHVTAHGAPLKRGKHASNHHHSPAMLLSPHSSGSPAADESPYQVQEPHQNVYGGRSSRQYRASASSIVSPMHRYQEETPPSLATPHQGYMSRADRNNGRCSLKRYSSSTNSRSSPVPGNTVVLDDSNSHHHHQDNIANSRHQLA